MTVWKTNEDGTKVPEDPTANFVWGVSDATVANIDAQGKITPTGKAGSVTVTLTALNGNVEGKQVEVESEQALRFGAGLTPFLTMSQEPISSVAGKDLTVVWTSNLCDKNGDKETQFQVTLTHGEETQSVATVTGTAANPASRVTIPGDLLSYDYKEGGNNTYTVTVSSTYLEQKYTAMATMQAAVGRPRA